MVGERIVHARDDFAVDHIRCGIVDARELQLVKDALVALDELDLGDGGFDLVLLVDHAVAIHVCRRGCRGGVGVGSRRRYRGRRWRSVGIGRRGDRRRGRGARRGGHVRVALVGGDVVLVHHVRVDGCARFGCDGSLGRDACFRRNAGFGCNAGFRRCVRVRRRVRVGRAGNFRRRRCLRLRCVRLVEAEHLPPDCAVFFLLFFFSGYAVFAFFFCFRRFDAVRQHFVCFVKRAFADIV